jgi:hypothetical protein
MLVLFVEMAERKYQRKLQTHPHEDNLYPFVRQRKYLVVPQ